MAGLFLYFPVRRPVYRAAAAARLWRCLIYAGLAAASTVFCAGCSTSYQLGALFGKDEDKPTGSVSAAVRAEGHDLRIPPDVDLAYAKIAAAEVLSRGGKDASQPWENPRSGARGTVTPLAAAYRVDGMLCRDFLASYISEGSESWFQGEACRDRKGPWEVRRLRPWRQS